MRKQEMDYGVYCGVDVGKGSHYLVALRPEGDERLASRPLPQDESAIREAFSGLSALGKVLVTVDQPGCIGSLVVAVAQDMGIDVAQLPPRAFRKAADTYGELKTDAFDAFVIADVSRATPRMIELVAPRGEALEAIRALSSFRADAVKERTSCYNRLHDLLNKACPPLEALFAGDALHTALALALLARYGGPLGLRAAGQARVAAWAGAQRYQKSRGPKMAAAVFAALSEVTVALPAAAVMEAEAKRLAARAGELEALVAGFDSEIAALARSVPEAVLLQGMPGMGAVLAPAIAAEVGDVSRFRDADHLSSYAGVAPVKRESGASLKGARGAKGGNRRLKGALFQYARQACLHDPRAKEYYDRKRAQGKTHGQALLALARRRVEVIYAILKSGTPYEAGAQAA
ncbi:MAG: IS110 family transposase [Eggerthellaceae bacterium]|nr:IS110 family transposase [Eggerthellaceae bacterium]